MALIVRSKVNSRFPCLWVDPDSTKNRVFIDNFAYDFTTLAPRFNEQWFWQNRANLYNTSQDFDDYTPMQTNYMDANCWAAANNTGHAMPGIFDLWLISLDYQNYKPRRCWTTALGRVIITYPRANDSNHQYGDWWMGYDMAEKAMSWRHQDSIYYCHILEQTESIDFIANSWSYSTTTITVNRPYHGLYYGDILTISGATTTTANAPNGTFAVVTNTDSNTFTYTSTLTPTGTAGGNMRVQSTVYRGWGLEHEGRRAAYATSGMITNCIQGYNYTYNDNDSTTTVGLRNQAAVSRPFTQQFNQGGWKFFLGQNGTNFYVVRVETNNDGNHEYRVFKYDMVAGIGTETTLLNSIAPTGVNQRIIIPAPSNIRTSSPATRVVFYSGHYANNVLSPMRLVWDKSADTVTSTDCTVNYPSGTTFATYSAVPTENTFDTFGYNVWWNKGHQFTINGIDYITFCQLDKFIYSNTARWPTRLSRTWLTFSIGTGTNDNILTFHSAYVFDTTNDFPLSWMPYLQDGSKLVVCSANNTGVFYFNPTSFSADGWSYVVAGSTGTVTVNKTGHGLSAGMEVTISGATTSTNAPNGTYTIFKVIDANNFTFIVDLNNTGLPTGTASGTLNVSLGWQVQFTTSLRARGYSVDSLGRLWVGVRTGGIGRLDVHLIKDNIPSRIDIKFQSPASNTTNKFEYAGIATTTNILVDALDYYGNRMAASINLSIRSSNMTFTGGVTLIQITTSPSIPTVVPVTITGPGQTLVSATTNI